MPVDGRMVVNEHARRRRDVPHASARACRARDAYHLVYRHGLAAPTDGQTLAMGSTTGGLWISEDGGERWHCVSRDLPPIAVVRFA